MSNSTIDLIVEAKRLGKHPISYSQISLFHTCPWAWKLRYVDKVSEDSGNIYTLFGSAIHTVIQAYLTKYFTKGVTIKEVDSMKLDVMLLEEMKKELVELRKSVSNPDTVTSKEEMMQFFREGVAILDYIKQKKSLYFSKKFEKLVAIEFPLLVETDSHMNLMFLGFIDLIIAEPERNKIRIIDIKTSTKGWHTSKKSDFLTSAQLLLYKKYYAKRLNVSEENIDIEFFIVKRQLYENSEYPQKRIQIHKPAAGKVNLKKAEKLVAQFAEMFDENGKVDLTKKFIKMGGSACKWCEFCEKEQYCPKNERMN